MPQLMKRYGFQGDIEEIEVEMDGPVLGYADCKTEPADPSDLDEARTFFYMSLGYLCLGVVLCILIWTVKQCL